jgi:hypothetical protein
MGRRRALCRSHAGNKGGARVSYGRMGKLLIIKQLKAYFNAFLRRMDSILDG